MRALPKSVQAVIDELSRLPGIGRRTAQRLAMHLLGQRAEAVERLANAILTMSRETRRCSQCHHLAETERCALCTDPSRDHATLCVVEDAPDVLAVESTGQYKGLYHVLQGVLSPVDGIGAEELNVETLVNRTKGGGVREVIFALSPTFEGDTTALFLYRKIFSPDIRFTTIARGVGTGDELEYVDAATLGRSLMNRLPYDGGKNQ